LDGGRSPAIRAPGARRLERANWPAVREVDARAFGVSRGRLLERLALEAPEYAWVLERSGGLQGYVLGRHGHVREHLGPLVANGDEVAHLLLESCLGTHPDRAVFVDVPDDQRAWRDVLLTLGFSIERRFMRMHRGRLSARGAPSLIYATTGPEFG
jgi:hypothetical protein